MDLLKNRNNTNWSLVYTITGASILCFTCIIFHFGFNEESIRMNIRWSARFSVICFCIAFSASAFSYIIQNSFTNYALLNRKYFGISFSIIHLIHLSFLVILHQYFDQIFIQRSLIELFLGGLAYAFLLLMLITSIEVFSKHISKSNWDRLHTIGGYWILIVYSNAILGRIVTGNYEYLPLGILLISVWIARIFSWWNKKISIRP